MIYILLGNGFEESEALVPLDLLRRAGAKVTLVGLDGLEITSSHGVTVKADVTMDEAHDPEDMEMLVLPGGLGGVESIQKNLFALALIQKAYDRGCWLCAICAAPTVLAGRAAWTAGRRCATPAWRTRWAPPWCRRAARW